MTTTALSNPAELPPSRVMSTWLTPQSFEAAEKIAGLMARCGTLPQHLQGKPADCFRVVIQSAKWQMDPFAVGECTSVVHGRLCFEGKLIAAVLQSMGAIEGHLDYEITGEGQASSITVTGTPRGATKPRVLKGTVAGWRTETWIKGDDGQKRKVANNWDKDPHSQLVYRGTRQWARLYAPAALLGVYTPDELEEIKEVQADAVHTTTADPKPAKRGGAKDKAPEAEKPADQGKQEAAHPTGPMGEITDDNLRFLQGNRDRQGVAEVLAKYNLKSATDATTALVRTALRDELAKLPTKLPAAGVKASDAPADEAPLRPTQKELNDLAKKLLMAGLAGQKRLRELVGKWKLESVEDLAGEGDDACIKFHGELVAEAKACGAIQ